MPFCSSCGHNLGTIVAKFCPGCGKPAVSSSSSSSSTSTSSTSTSTGGVKKHAPVQAAAPFRSGASTAYAAPAAFNAINVTPASHITEYEGNGNKSSSASRVPLSTAKPLNQITALREVSQGKQQSTFGGTNVVHTNNPNVVKCGLATTTYEKQPDWAYAEKHKNTAGQFQVGQFGHLNR